MKKTYSAYLLLGANLGDRERNLAAALEFISSRIGEIQAKSSIYETEPWGLAEQGDFLNLAAKVNTLLKPPKILETIQEIEQAMGRKKNEKWGPRFIDIDLLFFDDLVYKSDNLVLPHPNFSDRNFAMVPMMDLDPEKVHPVFHQTIEELYWNSKDTSEVVLFSK